MTLAAEQQVLFEYEVLDVETQLIVQACAEKIRERMCRSAQDIVEIGRSLIEVKERLGHGKFGDWLRAEFDWSTSGAIRFMQVSEQFKFVNLVNLSIAPSALYLIAAPSTPEEIREAALEKAKSGEHVTHSWIKGLIDEDREDESQEEEESVDYEPRKNRAPSRGDSGPSNSRSSSRNTLKVADPPDDTITLNVQEPEPQADRLDDIPLKEANVAFDTSNTFVSTITPRAPHDPFTGPGASDEHYTPKEVIEAVLNCFGFRIDLDPCSNSHHSPNVPSTFRFTKEDDGLASPWHATTLYMNPPYSQVKAWVQKLVEEYSANNVQEALVLVKADTSTKWFQLIWEHATAVCFVHHRLAFLNEANQGNSATFASCIAYFGQEVEQFYYAFHNTVGVCVQVMQRGIHFAE